MNTQFVRKSSNAKVGPIPTTTSARSTCPSACPLSGSKGGCYAEAGYYTRLNWDKVDSGERGDPWETFVSKVRKLPKGQLWRHNVAGDLVPSEDNTISEEHLRDLVSANVGKRGFTYTHYPLDNEGNLRAVKEANEGGFTVNASGNSVDHARQLKALGVPAVALVPSEDFWQGQKSQGDVVRCPAEYREEITCAACKLCSVATREVIVGFTAHGTQKKQVEIIASA